MRWAAALGWEGRLAVRARQPAVPGRQEQQRLQERLELRELRELQELHLAAVH